jgi:hypothetical protein
MHENYRELFLPALFCPHLGGTALLKLQIAITMYITKIQTKEYLIKR